MQFYDALYQVAQQSGVTVERIGLSLGHSAGHVSSSKSRGSVPRIDSAAKMLSVCGYKLCAMPNSSITDETITIDSSASE